MHRSKSARHAVTTPIAEISSLETTDIASTVVVSDRNFSQRDHFRYSFVRRRSIHIIHTLDSTDMKTSSFHTNTIDASGTIDAHIVRVSNTIDTLPSLHACDYFELSVLDADVHRINVTDGATFIGPVESVSEHTDRLDVGKRWNIYDTCHGFGVGV
jgi:hypothetical protein